VICMGGNTSLRVYHSFGAYFTCLKFGTSCGLFATMVCMRLCYMFYMCRVEHYVCSLMFVSSWYMCEMAMELLFGFSSLSYSELHID
jgi:hypothetical protein